MVNVTFTANLMRHVDAPPRAVEAGTIGVVLQRVFDDHPRLRGYILDDQGAVRKHVVVFVNGQAIGDRERLSDDVPDGSEVYVAQALSGG